MLRKLKLGDHESLLYNLQNQAYANLGPGGFIITARLYKILNSSGSKPLKAPEHSDLWAVLDWTLRSTDKFFRGLYQHGVWIPSPAAADIVRHGYAMTDTSQQSISAGW